MASRIGRPDSMDELVSRLLTAVGELFVISTAVDRPLAAGAKLTLANHGVVVVPPGPA